MKLMYMVYLGEDINNEKTNTNRVILFNADSFIRVYISGLFGIRRISMKNYILDVLDYFDAKHI